MPVLENQPSSHAVAEVPLGPRLLLIQEFHLEFSQKQYFDPALAFAPPAASWGLSLALLPATAISAQHNQPKTIQGEEL